VPASRTHNGGPLPGELPDELCKYFAQSGALPGWTDPMKLDCAQALFARCGFGVAVVPSASASARAS
jgi:hypothetical protein